MSKTDSLDRVGPLFITMIADVRLLFNGSAKSVRVPKSQDQKTTYRTLCVLFGVVYDASNVPEGADPRLTSRSTTLSQTTVDQTPVRSVYRATNH